MSYKNAEILTDKNGKPIPQYYDKEKDKFEPSSNEIKISNLPDIPDQPEDYPDKSVKEELELIKQENKGIKESQLDIISELKDTNETLLSVIKDNRVQSDTRHTGSNVEKISEVEGRLSGSSQYNFFGDGFVKANSANVVLDITKYSEVIIFIQNKGDKKTIDKPEIRLYSDINGKGEGSGSPFRYARKTLEDKLEAGSDVVVDSSQFEELKGVLLGITLAIWAKNKTDIKVVFWGRKY